MMDTQDQEQELVVNFSTSGQLVRLLAIIDPTAKLNLLVSEQDAYTLLTRTKFGPIKLALKVLDASDDEVQLAVSL